MEKNSAVVPTVQGTSNTPHQVGAVKYLKHEGGYLYMAFLGGLSNTNTSTTSVDTRRTPGRGGDFSGSTGTKHGLDGSPIRYEVRSSEGVAEGGHMDYYGYNS